MKNKPVLILCAVIAFYALSLGFADTAFADKSSVEIFAPDIASPGREITIEVQVHHHGNNFLHHTEWVYIKMNGKEVKRWEFSMFDKPEGENFTRSITYTVDGPLEITAEASCNIHGSAGIATKKVEVE